MRVLLVSGHFQPAWEWGGVVSTTWELSRALVQAGVEVTVLATDAAMQPPAQPTPVDRVEEGVRIVTCRVLGGRCLGMANRMAISPETLWRAARWVRWADLVHINGVWSPHVAQVWAVARLLRKPYLVSPHGNLERYSLGQSQLRKRIFMALYSRRILTGARAIHYTVHNEHHEAPAWLQPTPAVVVPCVVKSLDPGDGARFRQRLGLDPGDRLLGMVGRIHKKKGFDMILPAMAAARAKGPSRLVVVGPDEGGYLNEVEQMIRAHELSDRVTFTGMLGGQELADAYAGLDALVLPSYEENFGMVVVEAAAQGTPVIVSEPVGLRDWVAERGVGEVLPMDPKEWIAFLERVSREYIRDNWQQNELREEARERFSLSSVGRQMAETYERLAQS